MTNPSTISWAFKPENARSGLPPLSHPASDRSPLASASALSPHVSQIFSSPATPSSAASRLGSTPHRAVAFSPHRPAPLSPQDSAGSNGPSKIILSQDLLLPLMPSMEDSKLHNTVSGLRFALQQAQLNADSLQLKVSAGLFRTLYTCKLPSSNVQSSSACPKQQVHKSKVLHA